jgi:hypothetical protein
MSRALAVAALCLAACELRSTIGSSIDPARPERLAAVRLTDRSRADVLFVVDNSHGSAAKLEALQAATRTFLERLAGTAATHPSTSISASSPPTSAPAKRPSARRSATRPSCKSPASSAAPTATTSPARPTTSTTISSPPAAPPSTS